MSGWPLASPGFTVLDRFDTSTTDEYLTTVTADGTSHTKGAWVELDASTSQDCHMLAVNLRDTFISATDTGVLVDIGVGGSGSEVVLIPNILGGWQFNSTDGNTNAFPVFIPAGSRIAARCQAVISGDTIEVGVRLLSSPNSFNHDVKQGGNVVTYGADEANSRGTEITSTTIHTKGSWVQVTASTTEPHSALALSVQGHSDVSLSSQFALLDIGFGGSGSEQVILKDIMLRQVSTERMMLLDPQISSLSIGRALPVGTRLAARCQFSTGNNENLSLCLHGVT